jgi:thymidine kinase
MAKLYFYFSAMNAGKTTTLLQSNYNYQERGMQTLAFIPAIDTRKAIGVISSRIGLEYQAIPFTPEFDFFQYVAEKKPLMPRLRCILIDEAQFLKKAQVKQLAAIVDHFHLPVLTYGLRTDFLGEPFEGSQYLLAWAEELIEIKTICECGSKATMNLRIDAQGNAISQGEQIEIGDNDRYVSLCRKHFLERLHHAKSTA